MELAQLSGSAAARTPRDWARLPERASASVTPVAWMPDGQLDLREWTVQGQRLGVIGRGAGWWIGDWLRYGNDRFGERYVRAARITGYDVQTLMNMVYVASRFEPERRREALSFSHHAELAACEPQVQERWLDRAEAERLSVRCLRDELRREQRGEGLIERRTSQPRDHQMVCPECGCRFSRGSHDTPDGG